jgi:hypothetical protein
MLSALPSRTKDRKLNELPKDAKSSTESELPHFDIP